MNTARNFLGLFQELIEGVPILLYRRHRALFFSRRESLMRAWRCWMPDFF